MELFLNISLVIIYFGSGLGFLTVIAGLMGNAFSRTNLYRSLLLTSSSIILLESGLMAQDIPLEYPITIQFFITCLYLAGPAGFLYFNSLIHPGSPTSSKLWLRIHLMPAIVVFIFEIVSLLQPWGVRQELTQELFNAPTQHYLTLVIVTGAIYCFAYFAYLLKVELPVWGSKEIKVEVSILVFATLIILLAILALCLGFVIKMKPLFLLGGMLLSFIHVANFIAYHRYPHFFQVHKKEIKQKRYERSLLRGLDTDIIYDRLIELMDDEEIYKEMEINLKSLADRLSVTTHQLSQFLNERLSMDFRNFMNTYRIEEAKRMLIDEPGESILNICFEVGFSSKSAFYTAFKKNTGKTPREFRAEGIKNNNFQNNNPA